MGSRIPRLIAAAAALAVFASASPAWADTTTININPGNVPTTAKEHEDHGCDFGGGPLADKDIWVFNLPGNTASFISVTATWTTPSGSVTKTIPADGGAIVPRGTDKAWIAVDAGWTLTGASAVIDGDADRFVLTHTCPAGGSNPGPSQPPGTPGEPGQPEEPGESGGPGSPGDLPKTGTAITWLVIAGVLIAAAGGALVYFQRRRRTNVDDIV